ncbi:hypothetical protein CHS0354_029871 [Potamilus streckersoni]|uniref:Uncharacterized protein n=1 Tax=Potamilus streckersoni TaxID=2493646 RepID=A0AAE0TGA7_9BIVA|nr:hypothetical protein CHS0354_029871 [Potamilus streckersoni]
MHSSFYISFWTTVFSSFFLYVTSQSSPQNTSGTPFDGNAIPSFSGRPLPTDSVHFRLRGLCRDGWTEGSISVSDQIELPICLKINRNSLDWNSAQDTCRQDNGFLLKLETRVKIHNENLLEYLDHQGFTSIWTGLHEERQHLVWDSLAPYVVKPLNSFTETSSSKRPWHWGIIIPDDTSKVCGMLALKEQTSKSKDTRKRKRRTPDDEGDTFANPPSPDHESTGIAESLLSNLESSPSQVENFRRQLESSGLGGLQSAQKILPGSGSSVQNTQHGGISRGVGFLPQKMFPKIPRTLTTTPSDSESDVSADKITGSVISDMIDKAKEFSQLPEDHNRREPLHIDTGSILDKLSDVLSSNTNLDAPDDNSVSHSHPSPLPTDTKGALGKHSEAVTNDIELGKKDVRFVSDVSSTPVPKSTSSLEKPRSINPLIGKLDDHGTPKQFSTVATVTKSALYKSTDSKPPMTDIRTPSAGVNRNPTEPGLTSDTKSNSDKASESMSSDKGKLKIGMIRTENSTDGNTSSTVDQMKDTLSSNFKSKHNDSSSTNVLSVTQLRNDNSHENRDYDKSAGKDDIDKNKQSMTNIDGTHNEFIRSKQITDPMTTTTKDHLTTTLPYTRDQQANAKKVILDAKTDDQTSSEDSNENGNSDISGFFTKAVGSIQDILLNIKDKANETMKTLNDFKVANEQSTSTVSTTKAPQQTEIQKSITEAFVGKSEESGDEMNNKGNESVEGVDDDTKKNTDSVDIEGSIVRDNSFENKTNSVKELVEPLNGNVEVEGKLKENGKIVLDKIIVTHENEDDKLDLIRDLVKDDRISEVGVTSNKGNEGFSTAVEGKDNSMEKINAIITDKVLDSEDSNENIKDSVVEKKNRENKTEIWGNKNTNYTDESDSEEEDIRKNNTDKDSKSYRDIRGGLDGNFDDDILKEAGVDSDGALDQDSLELSEEAQLENQFRKQELQDAVTPDQLEPDKDHLDDTDLSEVLQPSSQKTPLRRGMIQRIMKLASCEIRLPSVCFSYQIEVPVSASNCEQGWYGHVLLGRCYKIMETKVDLEKANAVCNSLNATVFKGETKFYRDFVLLAAHRTGNFFRGTKFWMESPGCRYFDEQETQDTSCMRALNFICEKPSLNSGQLQEAVPNSTPEPRIFSSARSGNILQCGLTPSNSELPTLWFKDGSLVSAKMNRSSNVIGGNLEYEGISATLDDTRSFSLDPVAGAENIFKPLESAQGTYWCEVWDANPLRLRRSKQYFVTYSDVISMYGSLKHSSFTPQEVILFNTMNQKTGTLSSIEADLQKIFKDLVSALQASSPSVIDISVHLDRINSASGLIEVHAYFRTRQNNSLQEESAIFHEGKRLLSVAVNNAHYVSTLPGGTTASVLKTIKLRSTVFCPRTAFRKMADEDTKDDSDEDDKIETAELGDDSHNVDIVHFPLAQGGRTAFSEENCDHAGKVPSSQATCVGNFSMGYRWTNITHINTCTVTVPESDETETNVKDTEDVLETSPYTERLLKMSEIIVSDDNVEDTVKEIADIAEKAKQLAPIDIDHIADVLEKATELDVVTKTTGESVMKTMDKLMEDSFEEAETIANGKSKASNRIIKSLERYAEKVDMGMEKNIRMVTDNVAVDIWNLEPEDNPIIGLACQTVDQLNDVPFKNERISTIYNESEIFEANVDAAIELPKEIFMKRSKDGKRLSNRLYMMVFRKNKLFEAAATAQDRDIAAFNEKHVALLDSYIISASIAGQTLTNLKEKVKTVFKPLKNIDDTRKCVFWDFNKNDGKGGWSTAGCHYEGRVQGRDICMCDHLTNFAVLLDFYGQHDPIPTEHELSLSIISVIGLSFSILGLSLTIISYAFFRKLRKGRAQQTLFNLALALLLAMLVFLTGVKQTHNYYGCLVVAVLLHYLILVSFMWMLMSAILQYLTFVKVLGTYITRFTLKTVLPAWGLPLIPVISTLCIDYTLYRGGPDYCWMSLPAFYYGFSIPISLIIVVNVVIFCITIISISRRKAGLRSNQSNQKMAVTNLQAAVASFILLGLTWMFGYLAIADARLVFQYIFTILNSMQGFFIFILFVVRKKKVREQWYIVCCKGKLDEKASRTLSASNSIPSTYSNRSSRTERSSSTTSFTNHGYESFYDQPYIRRTSYNF